MRAQITPAVLRGTVQAPPSKSMAHRLMICAGLGAGESRIHPVDTSEDMLATADCLRALGADVRREGETLRIRGCRAAEAPKAVLCCRESGSTMRFLLPLCLLNGREMRLTGSPRLLERPMTVYETLCRERGFRMERDGTGITVQGVLQPGTYTLRGDVSSQFLTGMLFALSQVEGESLLRILPPLESRSYLEMTLEALRTFGMDVEAPEALTLRIRGSRTAAGNRTTAGDYSVEGDWSNAAFFEALNAAGGEVRVTGLREDSLQGDRAFRPYFRELREGCPTLDVSNCPDLAPVLMAVAALERGTTLTGTRRLRYKESDRGEAMARELAKFGVKVEAGENTITVFPQALHAPTEILSGHNDHRIVMALAVLCTRTGGVIEGAEAVRKSLPDFWERMGRLGAEMQISEKE